MDVAEIVPGLWRWTGFHPDWRPGDDWDREVASVYYEAPDAVVLIDPLVPPGEEERFWRALDGDVARLARPVAVLLTVFWHERSAQTVLERYEATSGASVWAPDEASGRLACRTARRFAPGDALPGEIVAYASARTGEVVYWLPGPRTLVSGDVLLGTGDGLSLCPGSWLPDGVSSQDLAASLRPLLDLPVERVLVSHGAPVLAGDRDALAGALSARPSAPGGGYAPS